MVMEIFEEKQPIRIKETIKKLPMRDSVILESLCTLYLRYGEEKQLENAMIIREAREFIKRYGLFDELNAKELQYSLENLEFYGMIKFVEVKKKGKSKDKLRKVVLEAELKELHF